MATLKSPRLSGNRLLDDAGRGLAISLLSEVEPPKNKTFNVRVGGRRIRLKYSSNEEAEEAHADIVRAMRRRGR